MAGIKGGPARLCGTTADRSVHSLRELLAAFYRPGRSGMADHNDPNSVNSIFADIDPSPADLYDMFGFPGPDPAHETVVVASTFAGVPQAGVLDPDLLYRMLVHPRRRAGGWPHGFDLDGVVRYVDGVRQRFTSP